MLWVTSLVFVPVAWRAFRKRRVGAMILFPALTVTSVLHHAYLASVLHIDRTLAHIVAVWGAGRVLGSRKVQYVWAGVYAWVAYYVVEFRVPDPYKDLVHATIHIVAGKSSWDLVGGD